MRKTDLIQAVLIAVVSLLQSTQRAEAQVAANGGEADLESISYPFTKPGTLFNATQGDSIDSLAELDWTENTGSHEAESDTSEDSEILQVSGELVIPPADASVTNGEMIIIDDPATAGEKGGEEKKERRSFRKLLAAPYSVYRSDQENVTWLPGSGDDFGVFDWATDSYLKHDEDNGFSTELNIHWLSGPTAVPLQSRVFDFIWAYQTRGHLGPAFSYDLSTSIGIYSDFEGSAREGVRFPSHAVGMFHFTHGVDFVFGIDYLDRDDISLLPVVGVSLRRPGVEGLRLDLIFPRPRISYNLTDSHRMYLAGELGGGSWDVELAGVANSVVTYRDYRLVLGFESTNDTGSLSAWEFGYVFDRSLEFRGPIDSIGLPDAFMINWVTRN